MPLVKDKIASLEISDELKADITSIFDQITAKETELENIRKKLPTDSQKVVESVDYEKFVAATNELAALKDQANKKLETSATDEESETLLSAFRSFFS